LPPSDEPLAGIITPFVFHQSDGARIGNIAPIWRAATERAGYPGRVLHDFGRTAVRNLECAGVRRSTATQMVGHQTAAIYRRYAIVDERMHREAAARLDAWISAAHSKPLRGNVRTIVVAPSRIAAVSS
jgi:hypothetical protein